MRILFIGSSKIAIPSLDALLNHKYFFVKGIISQPDKPAGRKKVITPTALTSYCNNCGLDVFKPLKIASDIALDYVKKINPDLIVVVGYGQFIPSTIINIGQFKSINLHPSLLPRYRGSTPIQNSLINGDKYGGVSIIEVTDKMDSGDIIMQKKVKILNDDDYFSLHEKLSKIGSQLLIKSIEGIKENSISKVSQNEQSSTYVSKILKSDGFINWNDSADNINNKIRAYVEWPGSYCILPDGKKLIVWKSRIENKSGIPGQILDEKLLIGTGKNSIRLLEVQKPGRNKISTEAFLNGYKVSINTKMLKDF